MALNPMLHVVLPPIEASSYPIWIDAHLLENPACWMPKDKNRVVIITDNQVETYYATSFERILTQQGFKTSLLSFPSGEQSKNITTKSQLENKLFELECDRNSLLLALGGGVVGDMAGFIAATYMRGIDYIQIPTTLLAMIDSSVGGKTGIDTPHGKNLIGAFWQPKAVVADITCLNTLPPEQIINGLIEAIKICLTCDAVALADLERNLPSILNHEEDSLKQLIFRAVTLKADIVKQDEKEAHQRAILNFGHTIGHAVEHLSNYKLLHGYAVALGLLVESKIAHLLGILEEQDHLHIKTLLARLNILSKDLIPFDVKKVIETTRLDKKKKGTDVNYVLLKQLGSVYQKNNQWIHSVPDAVVEAAFRALLA